MTFDLIELQATDLNQIILYANIQEDDRILFQGHCVDDWPEVIMVHGARFRCEETERNEWQQGMARAWYVPE